ncbi:hypothetical protein [Isobaculum melis]|uniref:Uncharacterized protein n=1 Tax=Isobaculum melis TaxID=142588 RepID=A0A1H9QSC9_9LACT|nr:hypothetical protein [Isobaculum melis]SER63501.1 hypothetical protein SAMN04488559_102262 [Isobaculum melis]
MNKKRLKISAILFFMVITIFYITSDIKKAPILAKQNQAIVLNEGEDTEFTVPKDAMKKGNDVEGSLLAPEYQNYWQNEASLNGLKKLNLASISTQKQERVFGMKRTTNGHNVFVVSRLDNNIGSYSGFWINVFNDEGELTDTIAPMIYRKDQMLGKSTNPNDVSLNFDTGNTTYSGIFEVSENDVTLVYTSQNEIPAGQSVERLKEVNFTIDNDGKIVMDNYSDENIKRRTPNDIFYNINNIFASSKLYNTDEFVSLSQATSIPSEGDYNGPQNRNYVINTFAIDPETGHFKWSLDTKEVVLKFNKKGYREFSPFSNVVKLFGKNGQSYYLTSLYAGENLQKSHISAYLFNEDGSYVDEAIMFDIRYKNAQYQLLPNLTTKSKAYYIGSDLSGEQPTTLFSIDVSGEKPVFKAEKKWSPGLYMNFVYSHETDGNKFYNYFAYTSKAVDEFKGYNSGIFYGLLDDNFNILSKQYAKIEDGMGISVNNLIATEDKYIVSGVTNSKTFSNEPSYGWQDKLPGNTGNAYFGSYLRSNDFSPLLTVLPQKVINLSNENVEEKLFEGVTVFDSYDLDPNGANLDRDFLKKRVNRNPKTLKDGKYAAIDWKKLGYTENKPGPNNVTYFIADSTENVTSKSVSIHNITNQTIKQEEVYFDAQNFSVLLKDVQTAIPDEATFKELAETMSWNEVTHEIYEDGKKQQLSDKVTVNQQQLADLQNATEAKPYPVDVTIEVVPNSGSIGGPGQVEPGDDDPLDPGGSGTGGGSWVGSGSEPIKVTNRVWVFVMTKNTVVDKDTGIVIYADDYPLPLQSAKHESMDNVYNHSNVEVYSYYDNTHETDTVLPAIADKNKTAGLTINNLEVITGAQKPSVVQPKISFTWDRGTTSTKPDVTLYAEILLHTRQVILSQSAELPIPSKGYLKLIYGAPHEANLTITSKIDTTEPAYTTSKIDFDQSNTGYNIDFNLIVPEYYRYKGYVVSDKDVPHQASALVEQKYQYSLRDDPYEIWLTLYIEPTQPDLPRPYSWDYQNNNYGELK